MGRYFSGENSSTMNILFALAGSGKRFRQFNLDYPKFLVAYNGAPMIYHAVKTLGIPGKVHFIVREEHLEKYHFLEKLLLGLGDVIVPIPRMTDGAAQTLLAAKDYIEDMTQPMVSANCDQFMDWDGSLFVEEMKTNPTASYIVTYNSEDPKCSFIKMDEHGRVIEAREKKVISNYATVGIYHWSKTEDFMIDAERMISEDKRDRGEYYVAPVYNYTIARGKLVKNFLIKEKEFWPVGTPEDLIHFEQSNVRFT